MFFCGNFGCKTTLSEEMIRNEVSLGGSPIINFSLHIIHVNIQCIRINKQNVERQLREEFMLRLRVVLFKI